MERRIDLHLRISYEPRVLRPWLALGLLLVSAADLGSENVTLTTYYPAPSGIYTQIIATGQTLLARDGGRVGIGLGVATPAVMLHVRNAPDQNLFVTAGTTFGGADGIALASRNNADSAYQDLVLAGKSLILSASNKVRILGGLDVTGSIRVNALASCTAQDFTDTTSCGALYATFTPGIYHEGWSYSNRGGAVLVEAAVGNFSTQVWGLDNCGAGGAGCSGNPRWMTLKKNDSVTHAYCCTK